MYKPQRVLAQEEVRENPMRELAWSQLSDDVDQNLSPYPQIYITEQLTRCSSA